MSIKDLQKPLWSDELEVRIQSINKGKYATILVYKDARVDMKRLDNVVWPLNWKKQYTNNNQNCIVSIYDESKKEWVSKEDVWTESITEQVKWLASDSFKRACFNWWIGRELYEYPVIQVKLNDDEVQEYNWKLKASFKLNLRKWKLWTQFKDWKITFVWLKDEIWKLRFKWGEFNKTL